MAQFEQAKRRMFAEKRKSVECNNVDEFDFGPEAPQAPPLSSLSSLSSAPSAPSAPPSYESVAMCDLSISSSDPPFFSSSSSSSSSSSLYPKSPSAPPPPAPASAFYSTSGPSGPHLYPREVYKAPIPMSQLKQVFSQEWSALLDPPTKPTLANIYSLTTHQGKSRTSGGLDSTNGCTVIAPLIASSHIRSSGGVSDDAVAGVIDQIAPPLLTSIRTKLGLGPSSLIIPSDVHDHFFDHNIITPDTFAGVNGGNVMSDDHIREMLKTLNENTGKKSACAFFFHAHVVCIVKMAINGGKETWYDLIDSLPREIGNVTEGTRTRCKNLDALRACLRWYASDKFGPADCEYIDRNAWDDENGDFDPRVFQSFCWAEW